MTSFTDAEWARARRALESAKQLLDSDPDSAASRAYYAVFHAMTAFFAARDQFFTRHTALRAAIHRELIQTGFLAVECGRDYDFLMDLRETADYGGLTHASPGDAEQAILKAENLIMHLDQT